MDDNNNSLAWDMLKDQKKDNRKGFNHNQHL